jgi:alcohol dehydrogenase class IV
MTTSGLGLVHALAHPVGVQGRVSHGVACALLIPPVLRFNWIADSNQFLRLALAMDRTVSLGTLRERDIVLRVIEGVEDLFSDVGLPKRLSEIGVSLSDPKAVVDEAASSSLAQVNPRQVSRKDVEAILSKII